MILDKEKLQDVLREKKLSRAWLASKTNAPLSSVNHWFSKRNPQPVYIFLIAKALKLKPSQITLGAKNGRKTKS